MTNQHHMWRYSTDMICDTLTWRVRLPTSSSSSFLSHLY